MKNGYTISEIFQLKPDLKHSLIERLLHSYYKEKYGKMPKIMNKSIFEENMQKGMPIQKIIEESHKLGFIIPESYIKEYLESNEEINLENIKLIVNRELGKLEKENENENININYLGPFEFAKYLKSKGYSTKYQAVALLYKLIKDNNLPLDNIMEDIENEEIKLAICALCSKTDQIDEYQKNIENNELAKVVYAEEQIELKIQKESSIIDENII